MRCTKVSGLGNDYCVFDADAGAAWTDDRWSELARLVSDRDTGIGSDGILVIGPGEAREDCITVATMRIFNADGSPGEMCGNGLRGAARLLVERGRARAGGSQGFVIATDAGLRTCWIDPEHPHLVRTTMGRARFGPGAVGAAAGFDERGCDGSGLYRIGEESARLVSVGNPHAVVLVDEPLSQADLARRGAGIERAGAFPGRINAQFARVKDPGAVGVQSWERGAGATSACGTGAAAVVAGLHRAGLVGREVVVTLPGGDLTIEITTGGEIVQTGPAEIESDYDWPIDDWPID